MIPEIKTATVFRRTFSDEGTFAAKNAAEAWCAGNGISVGESQGPAPRGLLVGDFYIAKWRNLNREERAALHGVMTGRTSQPPARGRARAIRLRRRPVLSLRVEFR